MSIQDFLPDIYCIYFRQTPLGPWVVRRPDHAHLARSKPFTSAPASPPIFWDLLPHFLRILALVPIPPWLAAGKTSTTRLAPLWPTHGELSTRYRCRVGHVLYVGSHYCSNILRPFSMAMSHLRPRRPPRHLPTRWQINHTESCRPSSLHSPLMMSSLSVAILPLSSCFLASHWPNSIGLHRHHLLFTVPRRSWPVATPAPLPLSFSNDKHRWPHHAQLLVTMSTLSRPCVWPRPCPLSQPNTPFKFDPDRVDSVDSVWLTLLTREPIS